MWRVIGFVTAVLTFFSGSASGTCDQAGVGNCSRKKNPIEEIVLFMGDNNTISETCKKFKDMKNCFLSLGKCSPKIEVEIDDRTLLSSVLIVVCSDDKVKQKFEEFSKCYHENINYFQSCSDIVDIKNVTEAFSKEECKEKATVLRCELKRIGEKCTQKEKEFVEELFLETERALNKLCEAKVFILDIVSSIVGIGSSIVGSGSSIAYSGSGILPQIWMMLQTLIFIFVAKLYF